MSRHLLVPALALAILAGLWPTPNADACSIASDYANPPEQEHAYDAQLAPDAPVMIDAYISHSYASDEGPGCGGISSCGDIHGLNLVVDGVGELQILRITHLDGSQVYAGTGWADAEGHRQVFLPGYGDVHESMPFRIAIVDQAGYPSLDVEWEAVSQEDNDPSCSAGGSHAGGLSTSLLVLLGLLVWRRKRR